MLFYQFPFLLQKQIFFGDRVQLKIAKQYEGFLLNREVRISLFFESKLSEFYLLVRNCWINFNPSKLGIASFLMASSMLRIVMFSPSTPTISLLFPSINNSTALAPIFVAIIRSFAVGFPPRCMWPKTVQRKSYSGINGLTVFIIVIASPASSPSETMMIDERFPLLYSFI